LIVSHGGVFHAVKSRLGLAETSDLSNATPVLILPAERRFDVIMRGSARAPIGAYLDMFGACLTGCVATQMVILNLINIAKLFIH
jgi:hypothetical protein